MVKGVFGSDSGNCGKPADARVSRGSGVLVAACRMDAYEGMAKINLHSQSKLIITSVNQF